MKFASANKLAWPVSEAKGHTENTMQRGMK